MRAPGLLERLGVARPVVQAGMGGGVARHELAAAVSAAGGLGTIGHLAPAGLRAELAAARERTAAPIAVNLLLPFTGPGHRRAAEDADLVVTFWGRPRRGTSGLWLHQCGSVDEARAARAAGADGVVVQGVEAGGHVRGREPALVLLRRARAALGPGFPILLAGGIVTADDVRRALDAGAEAAVLGTRFVLTEESGAHPGYRQRLIDARETILTDLFGFGWASATHRVVANAATRRWLGDGGGEARAPRAVRALNALSAPAVRLLPDRAQQHAAAVQHARLPLLSPFAPTDDRPAGLVDAGALYAGQGVARIGAVRPAGAVVVEVAGEGAVPAPGG